MIRTLWSFACALQQSNANDSAAAVASCMESPSSRRGRYKAAEAEGASVNSAGSHCCSSVSPNDRPL